MKDQDLKKALESVVSDAITLSVAPSLRLIVRNMGMSHASKIYKAGWYVFVQNFKNLREIKSSKNDQYVRFNFRIVSYRETSKITFQALIWHPSMGNQDNSKLVFEMDRSSGVQNFRQLITSVVNLTSVPVR